MDWKVARDVLNVIRAERERRGEALSQEENSDYAGNTWVSEELPFINELCLTLIVGLWHQLERELVHLAARVDHNGSPIDRKTYEENIRNRRRQAKGGIQSIVKQLHADVPDWMETLRLLANCYKHEPDRRPDERLLKPMGMPIKPTERLVKWYAPLPESFLFLKGLSTYLGVEQRTDYCAVAEEFIKRAEMFLAQVEENAPLSEVKWGYVSLSEFEG